ncbi:MAG: hypothetical protein GVY06_09650 [Alphaproteobacteria bacterium]|nr:hypothetical protein [Alphaproteobacteria bacterium]
MTFVKIILGIFIMVGLVGGLVWQFWLKDQLAFARLGTAYGAKMVCSCRFVAGRDMASCEGDFTVDTSRFVFEEGEDRIEVSVLGGLVSSRAVHEPGLGCAVVPS